MRETKNALVVHNASLDIYDEPLVQRKTSIICTIGPKTKSVEMLTELRKAGMNIVRMNFSHGSYEYHGEVIANTRESVKQNPLNGRPIAIALDTKGPEIRTGMLAGVDGGVDTIMLQMDAIINVTTDDKYQNVRARAEARGVGAWYTVARPVELCVLGATCALRGARREPRGARASPPTTSVRKRLTRSPARHQPPRRPVRPSVVRVARRSRRRARPRTCGWTTRTSSRWSTWAR
jgi:hypothetical protein